MFFWKGDDYNEDYDCDTFTLSSYIFTINEQSSTLHIGQFLLASNKYFCFRAALTYPHIPQQAPIMKEVGCHQF